MFSTVIGLCLTAAGFIGAAQVVVHLPEKVEVPAGTVRLSQVAALRGDADLAKRLGEIVVARVDQPGSRRMVSAHALKGFYLSALGVRDSVEFTGALRVEMRVRSAQISADQVREWLRDSLRVRLGDAQDAMWDLAAERLDAEYAIPEGDCEVSMDFGQRFRGRGQERALLRADCNGVRVSHVIPFQIRRWQSALVLVRDIHKGATLRPDDMREERHEITHGNRSLLESSQEAAGRITLRTMRKGTLVAESHLERPWRVRKGTPVRVMAQIGPGVVSAMGLAQENGLVGQIIAVENQNTRQVVHARVDEQGVLWVVN